jgi:hypothetical protein
VKAKPTTKPHAAPPAGEPDKPAPARLSKLTSAPLRWASAFVRHEVKFKRSGIGVALTLEDPRASEAPHAKAAGRAAPASKQALDQAELDSMRGALRQLLDKHAATRKAFVHLHLFEQALAKRGPTAWQRAPDALLRHALRQLEALVINWSDKGLAALRSHMSLTLTERSKASGAAGAPALSDFVNARRVQVDEVSPSDFDRVHREWAAQPAAAAP